MREVIQRLVGDIKVNPGDGTITVTVPYTDYETIIKRQIRQAELILLDSRPLSDKQRRACYAMINDIAEWQGDDACEVKSLMKYEYIAEDLENVIETFSLSSAPMSLVADFQRFLARFIIRNDIPSKVPLIGYIAPDDVSDYEYTCVLNKKCCVCGKKADLHHMDAVGSGRNRKEIVHEGMRVLTLCREHHTEVHQIGKTFFKDKYHLDDGIVLDKTLCRIYKLKRRNKDNE